MHVIVWRAFCFLFQASENFAWNIRVLKGQANLLSATVGDSKNLMKQVNLTINCQACSQSSSGVEKKTNIRFSRLITSCFCLCRFTRLQCPQALQQYTVQSLHRRSYSSRSSGTRHQLYSALAAHEQQS